MTFRFDMNDATNLGFVISQVTSIEPKVLVKQYPAINYVRDIPVDTSAHPWAKSITFFSIDKVGEAKVIAGRGDDVPMANITRSKFENSVSMGGIGYSFSLEEVGQAMMLGMNLDAMGADSANFSAQKFIDNVAYLGDSTMAGSPQGLYNTSTITAATATGAWASLTPTQILADVNTLLGGVYTSSLGIEVADTLKLPLAVFSYLASTPVSTNNNTTILEFLRINNIYTAQSGQPLNISADYRLVTAYCGANRAVAYAKDPDVLKLHLPMPMRFLPVQTEGLDYVVPGMFRLAGLDIRRPGAVRYMDGVI